MKTPLKSKTIWVALLTIGASICAYFAEAITKETAVLETITGAVMIILRFFTSKPIKGS